MISPRDPSGRENSYSSLLDKGNLLFEFRRFSLLSGGEEVRSLDEVGPLALSSRDSPVPLLFVLSKKGSEGIEEVVCTVTVAPPALLDIPKEVSLEGLVEGEMVCSTGEEVPSGGDVVMVRCLPNPPLPSVGIFHMNLEPERGDSASTGAAGVSRVAMAPSDRYLDPILACAVAFILKKKE